MTRDEIIAMAQEAIVLHGNDNPFDFRLTTLEQLETFAAMVAGAERAKCIKIAEEWDAPIVAFEIRKRGTAP